MLKRNAASSYGKGSFPGQRYSLAAIEGVVAGRQIDAQHRACAIVLNTEVGDKYGHGRRVVCRRRLNPEARDCSCVNGDWNGLRGRSDCQQ